MKDYYQILGIDEKARPEQIKSAFRKLAFKNHPDRNPGNESQAEEKFKEINEAYGVLINGTRRKEYDFFRRTGGVGASQANPFGGFRYSQEDIFSHAFAEGNIMDELNRVFSQSGLRIDEDFLNSMFFKGRGGNFQFFNGSEGIRWTSQSQGPNFARQRVHFSSQTSPRKPNLIERFFSKIMNKLILFIIKKAFGIDVQPLPSRGVDIFENLTISQKEAAQGCRKQVQFQRGNQEKVIEVDVPPGIASGNKIRLRGIGQEGRTPGDLYLSVEIK